MSYLKFMLVLATVVCASYCQSDDDKASCTEYVSPPNCNSTTKDNWKDQSYRCCNFIGTLIDSKRENKMCLYTEFAKFEEILADYKKKYKEITFDCSGRYLNFYTFSIFTLLMVVLAL